MSRTDGIFAVMDPLSQRFFSERQRRGLSIRELAATTKIREPYIEALERGRYDVLPAVYVRSFIRTLGSALGIPAAELASLMSATFDEQQDAGERLPAYQPTPPPRESSISLSQAAQRTSDAVVASVEKVRAATQQPMQQLQSVSTRIPRRALIGGAAVLLVILLWLGIRACDSSTSNDTATEDVIQVQDPNAIAPTDSIILTAVAQDTAWVSITMDGTRSQQVVVVPETEYRWSAMEKFVVSIQNAGAVQFFRNESPLPVFGKAGEAVREVKITRKDVTASNTAYKPPTQQAPPPKPAPKPAQVAPPKPKPAVARQQAPSRQRAAAPQSGRRQAAKPQRRAQPQRKPATTQRRRAIEQPIITPAPRQPIRR